MEEFDFAGAQKRVADAYNPELIRLTGHDLAEMLADHLQAVQQRSGKVLNWDDPVDLTRRAAEFLQGKPAVEPTAALERWRELVGVMLARGQNLHDPRYIGHQVPASIPLAGLFDAIGAVTNQVMAIFEMGPFATAVERAMVEKLGSLIGFPAGTFAGAITHGGSLANLTALLTARNLALGDSWERGVDAGDGRPVLIAQADSHYSVARSVGVLGLGTKNIVRAALDEKRRMDPARLDATIGELRRAGRPIVAVSASACATPIGAFDPLEAIADVCERHNVWLHVDAAHGGAACLSPRHRHLLEGLRRADSVVWDAHKMLFMPALSAFVFYKNRAHQFEAFRQDAPYLFDPSAPAMAEYDSGIRVMECTKRAQALGLWGTWSLFGEQLFTDLVDVTFELGQTFHAKLTDAADFVPLHVPQCNIVAFRHVPAALRDAEPERLGAFQLELRRKLIESGEYYIVPTTFEGTGALRVTIINPLTTADDLDGLMQTLRRQGRELLDC